MIRQEEKNESLLINASEIDAPRERVFIYGEHFPLGEPALISARGGVGKTTAMLAIAGYITQENIDHRILWLSLEGTTTDTLLKMEELELNKEQFYFPRMNSFLDFNEEEALEKLDAMCRMCSPVMVVVDSLRMVTSKGLNSKSIGDVMGKMNTVVCEQHGASLVYVHHENKSKGAGADRILGSTTIDASVRVAFSLTKEKNGNRRMECIKHNLKEEPCPIIFQQKGGIISINHLVYKEEVLFPKATIYNNVTSITKGINAMFNSRPQRRSW